MAFKNVTVAGSGVLGSQIAYQTAFKGFNVTIWLRSEGSIERAKPKLERLKNIYLETLEAMKTNPDAYCRGFTYKEELTDEEIDQLKENAISAYEGLTLTTSHEEAVKDADLIIEAIAEDPEQKIDLYQNFAKYVPEKTVIVTNSSTLLPSQFADYTGRPNKYLALHFANEIWKNNTAEIMAQPKTEQKYFDQVVEFAKEIGMVPLKVLKEQPGYILNSLLVPFLSAAEALWAKGVSDPETIDLTWKLATGAPSGPFQILDVVGLVTAYNIVIMNPEAKDPETVPGKIAANLKEKIDAGKTGVNAGEGFYKY
jgi:3-hydroxybutyryl-CoA dehydrogenase